VFFGRFIAVLRILAGPLAGALKMAYPRFLVANAAGGLCWAGGTTALVYYLGVAAERWLSRFSWIGLVVAVLFGAAAALFLRNRLASAVARFEPDTAGDDGPAASIS
jgi:membrane protein DedA with SNARE-associated domain